MSDTPLPSLSIHSRHRSRRGTALAALLSIVAMNRATFAQQGRVVRPDSAHTDSARLRAAIILPAVEVRASIAPIAAPIVGSGIPASIANVPGREMSAWKPRLLPDALASQPGVSLYDDLGTPWKINLSSRGFAVGPTVGLPPGISVFLDGVRQNEPDAQEVNFDLLPIDHIRRVELLNGAASLLGANSLGGAINLVTPRGAGPFSGEVETSAGSFGARSVDANLGGSASEWNYYLSGGAGQDRGWRAATRDSRYDGFLNIGRDGARRGFRFQAYAARSRAETAGSLPDSLFRSAPRTNFTPGDFEDLNAQQISASGYSRLAAGDASLTLYTRWSAAERFNVNQAPDPDVRGVTHNRSLGGTADWRRTVAVGAATLAIRLGLDGAMHSVGVRIYNESQAPTVLPVVDDDAASSALTTDVRSPGTNVAGYALAEYHVRRLTLSAGARNDYIRTPFRNVVDPNDDTTSSYHHVSPRAGITVALSDGASIYASVSGAFRAPAILELGCADPSDACPLPFALGDDPPLKPVTATTYEIGGRMLRRAVLVTGSLYRTDVSNEIFFIASERALLSGYFTNLDRTRREGGELSVLVTVSDALEWHANYAFTRATFQSPAQIFSIRSDDDFETNPLAGSNTVRVGNRLPLVPEYQVKAGFIVRGSSVNAGIEGRYTGRQWFRGDEANETTPLPSYLTASVRVAVTRGAWELASVIDNVLDSHAAIFGTFNENRRSGTLERFLTPMNARAFRVSLARNLGRGARE